jgi:hypothetical protein
MITLQEKKACRMNNQMPKYGFGENVILKYLLNDFLGEFCSGISFYPGRYISPNEMFEELKLRNREHFNAHLTRLKQDGLIGGCENSIKITDDALLYALTNLRCVFDSPMKKFDISSPDMEALVRGYLDFRNDREGEFKLYQDFVFKGRISKKKQEQQKT